MSLFFQTEKLRKRKDNVSPLRGKWFRFN